MLDMNLHPSTKIASGRTLCEYSVFDVFPISFSDYSFIDKNLFPSVQRVLYSRNITQTDRRLFNINVTNRNDQVEYENGKYDSN